MSHHIQIRSGHAMPDVADPLAANAPGGEPMESIFSRVHRLLRGQISIRAKVVAHRQQQERQHNQGRSQVAQARADFQPVNQVLQKRHG